MATTGPLTVEDVERMEPDDGGYELIRGELHRMAASGGRHSRIGVTLGARPWIAASPQRLGSVYGADAGFVLARNPDTVFMPDIAFVRADRVPSEAEEEGILRLAPDLAVEIVSPTDRASAVREKVPIYRRAAARLVWVIDPRQRLVTAYGGDGSERALLPGDELDGGAVLPGFRVPVAEIF